MWLDIKKTDLELRPNTWVRRAATFLQRVLVNSDVLLTITPDLRTKEAEIDGVPMGCPGRDDWVWYPAVDQYLAQDVKEQGKQMITR